MFKNQVQQNRMKTINQYIKNYDDISILEIGPQACPTFLKHEADIYFLDYDVETDNKQYFASRPDELRKIPKNDYLVTSDTYSFFVDKKFDLCIANHVIEHVDDIILWLNEIDAITSDNGMLFLSIPDKKYTFDKFRQNTTIAHIIADYIKGGSHSAVEHIIEIELLYDKAFIGKAMDICNVLNKENLIYQATRTPWTGLHRHVFEFETFNTKIISPRSYSGFTNFYVEYYSSNIECGGEFHCILRKGKNSNFDSNAFLM